MEEADTVDATETEDKIDKATFEELITLDPKMVPFNQLAIRQEDPVDLRTFSGVPFTGTR